MNIPTPHIEAKKGDFAKTVLMPGDPLRARFIAEHYLEDAVLVNSVRQMSGYTGTYKGKRVSVMASGMGMPSMGIYSYELFNGYDVENIIRIGTAGALREDLHLRDLVFGIGACTNSNFAAQYQLPGSFAPTASFPLLRKAVEAAEKREGLHYMVGNLLSSDTFYNTLRVRQIGQHHRPVLYVSFYQKHTDHRNNLCFHIQLTRQTQRHSAARFQSAVLPDNCQAPWAARRPR